MIMPRIGLWSAAIVTAVMLFVPGGSAQAQATRTWVSGVGDDANPCSRTAPCKTWAGAISKTAAGGEIDALDPGGFGALTITKAITLDGGGGQVASTLVSGTNGFNVAAGANDIVIIRNIRVNGLGQTASPGINGINYSSGAQLVVDSCDIFGFSNNGINLSLTTNGFLQVRNTTIRNTAGNGVGATSTAAAIVQIRNSSFVGTNSAGTPAQGGVSAGSNAFVTVSETNFQDLAYGAQTQTGGTLNIDRSIFSSTTNAILTAAGTTANVTNNVFFNNGTAFGGTGSFVSAGDNKIVGNQGATPTAMTVK
jgi:hypothetical protein